MPQIRECTREDADPIALIYNQSVAARDSTMHLEPIETRQVQQWIEHLTDREALLVLEEAGRILGWGVIKRYSDRAGYRFTGETSVYLRRDQTGQGYGSMMQAALIERGRAYGYHHLVAKIWVDNEVSIGLHRKFGYEMVGVQKEVGWVDDRWHDVAIMQKLLEDGQHEAP